MRSRKSGEIQPKSGAGCLAPVLSVLIILGYLTMGTGVATAQRPAGMAPCNGLVFSTEEDFLSQGPKPADGNPIISDGDLLSRNFLGTGVAVCARNRHLLRVFETKSDLGLDAVDVIDSDKFLIAFSTELDDPRGRFTAGDLLTTDGAVLPNSALLALFRLPEPEDIGLDAVHLVGEDRAIARFLEMIKQRGRSFWVENPRGLIEILQQMEVDIWFSTEGTGPMGAAGRPTFLDGDLLSARKGTIVTPNADFLPALPAGLPTRGVDFGLDAFTVGLEPIDNVAVNFFSTEIVHLHRPAFTDGDILREGGGIIRNNYDLIAGLEPKVRDVGLDALDLVLEGKLPPCEKLSLEITVVGGIYVSLIHPTTGYARKQDGSHPPGAPSAPAAFDSPFGQWVSIRGRLPDKRCVDVTKYEYRIQFQEDAGPWVPIITHPNWQVLAPAFLCSPLVTPWTPYQSDGDGWIPLSDYWDAKVCRPDQALNVWNTSGKDGLFRLRLVLRESGNPASEILSAVVPAFLDNTAPAPVNLTLYNAAGTEALANQCQVSGTPTDTIIAIKGQVRDKHFRVYGLSWTGGDVHTWPSVPLHGTEPSDYRFYDGTGRTDLDGTGTLPPGGDVPLAVLNLTTAYSAAKGEPPIACGYTIQLTAVDRTIRGRFFPSINLVSDRFVLGWRRNTAQSFCFTPAE